MHNMNNLLKKNKEKAFWTSQKKNILFRTQQLCVIIIKSLYYPSVHRIKMKKVINCFSFSIKEKKRDFVRGIRICKK